MNYVLDTNIVSYILKANFEVNRRFALASAAGHRFLGCPVVWFEIRRGLLHRDAKVQITAFEELFVTFHWDDYTRADWQLAAELWAQRRAQGRPIANADLLIAVFARNRAATVVTDNSKDFEGLDLTLENWLQLP